MYMYKYTWCDIFIHVSNLTNICWVMMNINVGKSCLNSKLKLFSTPKELYKERWDISVFRLSVVHNVLVVVHRVCHMVQGYWHPCKFNFMYSIVVQLYQKHHGSRLSDLWGPLFVGSVPRIELRPHTLLTSSLGFSHTLNLIVLGVS